MQCEYQLSHLNNPGLGACLAVLRGALGVDPSKRKVTAYCSRAANQIPACDAEIFFPEMEDTSADIFIFRSSVPTTDPNWRSCPLQVVNFTGTLAQIAAFAIRRCGPPDPFQE